MTADDHPMPLTFVVGSGRCGSTMVSRVVREHPDVLSISEIFSGGGRRETNTSGLPQFDGRGLWDVLSTPQPHMDALYSSGLVSELCYPRDGRFKADPGIPPICHCLLPMLSNDPDALFDLLAAEVPTWPTRSGADTFRSLFRFLGQLLGKRVTVERSGGSIVMMPLLLKEFPEARFVHIHRNGPDCAVSMSRHMTFRMRAVQMMVDNIESQPGGNEGIAKEFRTLITDPVDVERLRTFPIPLTFFGHMWSVMIQQGLTALADLPADRQTTIRYEDVLTDPAAELTKLADFIGVAATPQWLTTATALVSRPRPVNISVELPPDALAAVKQACAPGIQALAESLGEASGEALGEALGEAESQLLTKQGPR